MPFDDRNIDAYTIADFIINRNILDKKTVSQALDAYIQLLTEEGFTYYSLKDYGKKIELNDDKGSNIRSMELPVQSAKNIKWLPYSSDNVLAFDESDETYKELIKREKGIFSGKNGGLLRKGDKSFVIRHWIFEMVSSEAVTSLPLDLYIPEKQSKYIFLADRGSNTLYIASSDLKKIISEFKVRQANTSKAINLAFSAKSNKCYITDNQSPDMIVLNLENNKLERFYEKYGSMGNLVISKDETHLYVINCDSENPDLMVISTNGFKLVKRIALKGKLFSDADDPTDLISISPNGKYIYVMTHLDKPALFTPVISVISTSKNEIVRQIKLDKDEKPVSLAFKANSGLKREKPSFSQLLIDKKLMLDSSMQKVLDELQSYKQTPKEFNKTELLDQDVSDLQAEIVESIKGQEKELSALLEPSEEELKQFLSDHGMEWQGRKMSKEDKESLIRKMSEIKGNKEVSETNGIFVLNWMNNL